MYLIVVHRINEEPEHLGMAEKITIYEPDNSIKKGYVSLFKEMKEEVTSSKFLMWQLFKRDIKAVYKQSVLGIFWVLIVPAITLGTFIVLNRAGIFNAGDISVPYPIFALLGIIFWQLFATGLLATTNSLVAAGSMINKINFPREALVFSSLGQSLVAFLIQIVVLAILFIIYAEVPQWTIIFVPLTIIPILLLTLGLGMILSILNGVMRDIGKGLPIFTTFLMLMTPILYATPTGGIFGDVTKFNPLFYLTTAPRDLIIVGELSDPYGYLFSVLLSIIVFSVCWIAFHLTETRISERI